jgi:hypothetical protein
MKMKNLIKAIVISTALLFTVPALAQNLRIYMAPPASHTEIIPDQPSAGAIWQPGYFSYDMNTESYFWVSGQWVMPPVLGATWVAPAYQYDNGAYMFIPGRWEGVTGEIITVQPRQDDLNRDLQERENRQLKKLERNREEIEDHERD